MKSIHNDGVVTFSNKVVSAMSTTRNRPDDRGNLVPTWYAVRQSDDVAYQTMAKADRVWLAQKTQFPIQWVMTGHGNSVWDLDAFPSHQPEANMDAVITSQKNRPVAILTADCTPAVIYATNGSGLGLVHAGWKGLALGVIPAAVAMMQQKGFGELHAWIGPCVYPQQYEVGRELLDVFAAFGAEYAACYQEQNALKGLLNIPRIAQLQLEQAGVTRVTQSGWCTHWYEELFYSHRRSADKGRIATVAWLPE